MPAIGTTALTKRYGDWTVGGLDLAVKESAAEVSRP